MLWVTSCGLLRRVAASFVTDLSTVLLCQALAAIEVLYGDVRRERIAEKAKLTEDIKALQKVNGQLSNLDTKYAVRVLPFFPGSFSSPIQTHTRA